VTARGSAGRRSGGPAGGRVEDRRAFVVIGGGVAGTAIAWALAGRGERDVLVLERHTLGCGGTGRSSGVVRWPLRGAVAGGDGLEGLLLFESAAERLGADVGFRPSGYLVGVGGDDAAALAANVEMAARPGRRDERPRPGRGGRAVAVGPSGRRGRVRLRAARRLRRRLPDLPGVRRGGAPRGVRIRQRAPVRSLTERGGRVVGVELLDGERVAAGTVVLAAGWWSAALAAPLGVEVPMKAQHEVLLVVDPGRPLGPVRCCRTSSGSSTRGRTRAGGCSWATATTARRCTPTRTTSPRVPTRRAWPPLPRGSTHGSRDCRTRPW